jgi:steroid 5-alpha reductase family enzyme
MRAKRPDGVWPRSLVTIFALQGALVLLDGWPVITAAGRDAGDVGALAVLGAVVWAVGLFFEAVGDWQLARFKADPANRGQVMDRGLWRLTRHPNYFGDATVWAGLWLIALDAGVTPLTVVSPVVMTFLIVKVSGVAMLERHMAGREKYAEYIRRTSVFVPLPPKKP